MSAFRLSPAQRKYAHWVGSVATEQIVPLAGRTGSAVNRPILKELGRLGLLRGLYGGTVDGHSPRLTGEHLDLLAPHPIGRLVFDGVQLHGAVALQQGHLLEHLYRDVRSLRIYEGASEIQRSIIARDLIRQAGQQ